MLPAPSAEPARRARGPKPEVEIDNEALIVAMNAEIESGCTMRDAARRVLGRRGLWATSGKKSGANNERRARVLGPEIRVMCVSPGAVATDFVAGRGRPELEKLAMAAPLKRVTEPEDVALAIMACITHMPMSTGGRIVVDGGRFLV